MIGPLKGKENASNMIERLKMAGHANCIRPAARVETLKIPPSDTLLPRENRGPLFRFCNQGLLVTTIGSIRRNGHVVIAGDGQATPGNTVMKGNVKKCAACITTK